MSPRDGSSVPKGLAPTFSVRIRGGGEVDVRVRRSSARRASDGLICASESIDRARRGDGGLHRYRPRFHDHPGFWLDRPGIYHWQAHRIRCEEQRTRDCRQEGPVSELRVR